MSLPVKQKRYVVVPKATATAIDLHSNFAFEQMAKLHDAVSPMGGLHVDHMSAAVAVSDIVVAVRYIERLITHAKEEGIFTDGD